MDPSYPSMFTGPGLSAQTKENVRIEPNTARNDYRNHGPTPSHFFGQKPSSHPYASTDTLHSHAEPGTTYWSVNSMGKVTNRSSELPADPVGIVASDHSSSHPSTSESTTFGPQGAIPSQTFCVGVASPSAGAKFGPNRRAGLRMPTQKGKSRPTSKPSPVAANRNNQATRSGDGQWVPIFKAPVNVHQWDSNNAASRADTQAEPKAKASTTDFIKTSAPETPELSQAAKGPPPNNFANPSVFFMRPSKPGVTSQSCSSPDKGMTGGNNIPTSMPTAGTAFGSHLFPPDTVPATHVPHEGFLGGKGTGPSTAAPTFSAAPVEEKMRNLQLNGSKSATAPVEAMRNLNLDKAQAGSAGPTQGASAKSVPDLTFNMGQPATQPNKPKRGASKVSGRATKGTRGSKSSAGASGAAAKLDVGATPGKSDLKPAEEEMTEMDVEKTPQQSAPEPLRRPTFAFDSPAFTSPSPRAPSQPQKGPPGHRDSRNGATKNNPQGHFFFDSPEPSTPQQTKAPSTPSTPGFHVGQGPSTPSRSARKVGRRGILYNKTRKPVPFHQKRDTIGNNAEEDIPEKEEADVKEEDFPYQEYYAVCKAHEATINEGEWTESECKACQAFIVNKLQHTDLCSCCAVRLNVCMVRNCMTANPNRASITAFSLGRYYGGREGKQPCWVILKDIGTGLYREDKFKEAALMYSRALRVHGGLMGEEIAHLYSNRAAAYMMDKKFSRGISDCDAAITAFPRFEKAYLRGARAALHSGQTRKCKSYIETLLTFVTPGSGAHQEGLDLISKSESLQVLKMEISKLYQRKRYAECLEAVKRARQIAEFDSEVATSHIQCLAALGRWTEVKSECLVLAQKRFMPKFLPDKEEDLSSPQGVARSLGPEVGYLYARAHRYLGQAEEARSVLFVILLTYPKDGKKAKAMLDTWDKMARLKVEANQNFNQGQHAAAHRLYSKILLLDPHDREFNAVIYCNRAAASMELNDVDAAISDCKSALQLNSKYSKARLRLARCCVRKGKYQEAIDSFDSYLTQVPDADSKIRLEREEAKTLLLNQRRDRAQRAYAHHSYFRTYADTWSSEEDDEDDEDDGDQYFRSNQHQGRKNTSGYSNSSYGNGGFGRKSYSSSYTYSENRRSYKYSGARAGGSRADGGSRSTNAPSRTPKQESHYHLLGISVTATSAEIKQAYRALALRYHPDKCKEESAGEKFKQIANAYHTLKDPAERKKYDYQLKYGAF